MKMRGFLSHYRKIRGQFELKQGFNRDQYFIRIATNDDDCPVTAVCREMTGFQYGSDDCFKAARKIGFPAKLADRVVDAADMWPGHDRRLRQKLLPSKNKPSR